MKLVTRVMARNRIPIYIGALLLLELAMLSFLQNFAGPYVSPVILLLSGLLSGVLFIRYTNHRSYDVKTGSGNNRTGIASALIITCVLAAIFGFVMVPELNKFPFPNPQEAADSDIIPQIQILVQRWLSGEFPYQLIEKSDWAFEHKLYPTYLPLTWMPFVIAEKIGMDYRWFAYLGLIGAFFYSVSAASAKLPMLRLRLLSAAPFVILFLLILRRPEIFSLTIESLIAAFYLCFAISLLSTSTVARGIFLLMCLLSRFSIVLWVPLFFLVIWHNEEKRKSLLTMGILILGFVLIYYVPFLMEDPEIFKLGYDYHSKAAVNLWLPSWWQAADEIPYSIGSGMGFGIYFYELSGADIADQVSQYRLTHFVMVVSVVIGLSIYYMRNKLKINQNMFLLGSLKIYLVIFYSFIQLPFHYLFLIPLIVSVPMARVLMTPSDPRNGSA